MRPARLPEKILQIRKVFGDTQEDMARRLGFQDISREYISGYELGKREPPLPVLLEYARAANVSVEALIDDGLDLPDKLPPARKSEGVRRMSSSLSKRPVGKSSKRNKR
jgi:transcriptional regulator with XRE-family HTH domain